MVDVGGPDTERQARRLDGDGKARSAREDDPASRAMAYLAKVYEKVPLSDRSEFISCLQGLLGEMQMRLERESW